MRSQRRAFFAAATVATVAAGAIVVTVPTAGATSTTPATLRRAAAPHGATGAPAPAGDCALPENNVWRADISGLPVHNNSKGYVDSVGGDRKIHPDFGSGVLEDTEKPFGIPVTTVPAGTPGVAGHFTWDDESDPGPYKIPPGALIEGGPDGEQDRHVIALDPADCSVYELFNAWPRSDGGWDADSGAIFDLRSNRMRTLGHTSADAAGLSIYAGLVRYDEVAAGRIDHALRMTVRNSQRAYVWPASHFASTKTDPNLPPMGLRFRLKDSVDISGMPPQARVIAQALKTYGAIVADNGGNWFFSGTQDDRWDNDDLRALKSLTGNDFEAIDATGLMVTENSYEARR